MTFSKQIKKDKKTAMIIILGVLGVLLMFASEFTDNNSVRDEEKIETSNRISVTADELERIISEVEGVGRVRVLINYEGSAENIYARNISEQEKESDKKTEQEHIIVDKGSAEDGLIVKEVFPRVTGIAVVCEGGGSSEIKNEITQMLKALFNINRNNISISEMGNQEE